LLLVSWLSIAWLWWLSIPSPRSTIWITHYYSEEKKVIYCHYFLFCSHWQDTYLVILWVWCQWFEVRGGCSICWTLLVELLTITV
jgi:hypothetical protein